MMTGFEPEKEENDTAWYNTVDHHPDDNDDDDDDEHLHHVTMIIMVVVVVRLWCGHLPPWILMILW